MESRPLSEHAFALHAEGRLVEAESAYRRLLQANPRDTDVLRLLAVLQGQQGRLAEAIQQIEQALRIAPHALEAWRTRGEILSISERPLEALESYERVLAGVPHDRDARHRRAQLLFELGRTEDAWGEYAHLLDAEPGNPELLNEAGHLLAAMGRQDAALACFDRALAIRPDDVEAHNNRGNVLGRQRRFEAAVESFDAALAIWPELPETLANRGLALTELGRCAEALDDYSRAIALSPNLAAAWTNQGVTLGRLGRLGEAVQSLERALELEPADPDAMNQLGKMLCEAGDIARGFETSSRAAWLAFGAPIFGGAGGAEARRRHDEGQAAYLGRPLRNFHLEEGDRVAGHAVARNDVEGVAASWAKAEPKYVVVDDLLSPDALASLRRFCLGSTIWWSGYDDGYVGAFPETGLACPLVAQIAEELSAAHPTIFGEHRLRYVWAFKYDDRGGGTHVHADEAAINVNFWITPDEANEDPERGGLVFWDKAAPAHWDFARYNEDEAALRAFIAESGARATRVPYRANRAVIFDSNLIHATDAFRFRPGYANRRINVTMLFGRRSPA